MKQTIPTLSSITSPPPKEVKPDEARLRGLAIAAAVGALLTVA